MLVSGVMHLDQESTVFEAMLTGLERRQKSRMLAERTMAVRLRLVGVFAVLVRPLDHGGAGAALDLQTTGAAVAQAPSRG